MNGLVPFWMCLDNGLMEEGRFTIRVCGTNQQACSLHRIKNQRRKSPFGSFGRTPVFSTAVDICLQVSRPRSSAFLHRSLAFKQGFTHDSERAQAFNFALETLALQHKGPFHIHPPLTLQVVTVGLPHKSFMDQIDRQIGR